MNTPIRPKPPVSLYLAINIPMAMLVGIGMPIFICNHYDLPTWATLLIVLIWLLASNRILDRHLPRLTNPIIEWMYCRTCRRH